MVILIAINITLGKAGRSRWLGKKPKVRGVVKNPIDHPHGGGEGRSPIGRPKPVTPWGKPALGIKTSKQTKQVVSIFYVHADKKYLQQFSIYIKLKCHVL